MRCHKRKVERTEGQRRKCQGNFSLLTDASNSLTDAKKNEAVSCNEAGYLIDTTRHETRSELKPWHPRVLHAACASEPADRLRADWMRGHYSPKGSGDYSEVKTRICIRTRCNGRTRLARRHLDVLHHIRLYRTSQITSAKVRMGVRVL